MRSIEVDAATARLLKARAAKRGMSVAELVAEMLKDDALPKGLERLRRAGKGPWAPEILAEDVRRVEEFERTGVGVPWEEVEAWMRSWGTPNELSRPKPRKL